MAYYFYSVGYITARSRRAVIFYEDQVGSCLTSNIISAVILVILKTFASAQGVAVNTLKRLGNVKSFEGGASVEYTVFKLCDLVAEIKVGKSGAIAECILTE